MKNHLFYCFLLLLGFFTSPAFAAVEPDYDPGKPPVTTPWFANQGKAEQEADLWFIKGMRPHHAGALTMSDEYLKSGKATNEGLQRLARGIVKNQTFEIGMLDRVEELVGRPVVGEREWRQIAEKGLAQKQRFIRAPMPGPWTKGRSPVSVRDVQFAKAMVIHHQGALDMCREYLDKPTAENKYLRLLCLDIFVDQQQEIDFMNAVVGLYPGNPDDVKIDSSMIHGMEGMSHGGNGGGHDGGGHAAHKQSAKPKEAHDHGHTGH